MTSVSNHKPGFLDRVLVIDDLPLIPLLYYKTKHMVSKKVHGWTYNNLDFHLGRYMSVSAN